MLEDFYVPRNMQEYCLTYSISSGKDGMRYDSGKQCVLYFNWNSDNVAWNLNANDLDDGNDDGNCFFSRNCAFPRASSARGFCFDAALPSAEHLAYFFELG